MKKIKRQVLSALFALALLTGVLALGTLPAMAEEGALTQIDGVTLEGAGTKESPYQIADAADLRMFEQFVNDGKTTASAVLTNDVDLSEICGESVGEGETAVSWTPIGNSSSNAYTGTFDGNGHSISGLFLNTDANYQGLFGIVGGNGTVKNLTVEGQIIGAVDDSVGGITANNNAGLIENCTSNVIVNSNSNTSMSRVGGIVGVNRGTIKDCTNTGNITITATNANLNVGGIAGDNSGGTIENCRSTGDIQATGKSVAVGGVAGWNTTNCSITNSYNTGDVSGKSTEDGAAVGGVVGENSSSVTKCYNTGGVNGETSDDEAAVGGIVGSSDGTVADCTNSGDVSGESPENEAQVGGVVGGNGSDGRVSNCNNTGAVSGNAEVIRVGGVGGNNNSSIENCINTGNVTGESTDDAYVGGVVGENTQYSTVTNCYYLDTTAAAGIGYDATTASEVAAKSVAAFHSGEVAHLLGDGWGQRNPGAENSWPELIALAPEAGAVQPVYQVTLIYGDYTGAPAPATTYTIGAAPADTPSRPGYTFAGWQETARNDTARTLTFTARWTEIPYTGKYSYEITTAIGDHGSLSVDRYATEGERVTLTIAPDEAYLLDELSVTSGGKDIALTANSDGTYTFTMPSADVAISATFAEDPNWTPDDPATDVTEIFRDVPANHWALDAIQYVYDHDLMTGTSAAEFSPELATTRGMLVSILYRLEGNPDISDELLGYPYADVTASDWYGIPVYWARLHGIVAGFDDNTFRPNDPLTREQLASMLMNYARWKGQDTSARADLSAYTDQPSTWASDAMRWAVAEGYITGVTSDQLQPQGNATRAQLAAILQRFLAE